MADAATITKPSPPPADLEVPRYEVLGEVFMAPYLIKPGAIIAFRGLPHDKLRPLNKTAALRMEEYYNKEYPVLDKDGKQIDIRKPNLSKRPGPATAPGEEFTVELISAPPPPTDNVMGLAESIVARAKEWAPPGPIASRSDGPPIFDLTQEG